MRQIRTMLQHCGPDHLELWLIGLCSSTVALITSSGKHGLCSNTVALITSDCGALRSLGNKWPWSPRVVVDWTMP